MIEPGTEEKQDLALVDRGAYRGQIQRTQVTSAFGADGGNEASLRDFLNILRRRHLIAIQTFVVIVSVGAVTTFMTKPQYQSKSRILVEGKANTIALNNTNDPMANLFIPPSGHDVATQVEVLNSPSLLSKVCDRLGTTMSVIDLDVSEVKDTDVIEIAVTASSRDLAQRFADSLPQQYVDSLKESGMLEVSGALKFAELSLKEKNASLALAEQRLQEYRDKENVVDPSSQMPADIAAASDANASEKLAQSAAAGAHAALNAVRQSRGGLSKFVDVPTTVTNPDIATVREQLETLKSNRAQLLFLYKPDHPKVRQIDDQIADLTARLARTPATVTTSTKTINPLTSAYDQRIADASAAAASADASLTAAHARVVAAEQELKKYPLLNRTEAQLDRDIENGKSDVAVLSSSVEELSLREKAAETKTNPITIIAPASRPLQVAPQVLRNLILAVLLGLLVGCGAAMLQDSLDDHINNEDELRWLLDVPILGHLPLLPEGESRLVSLRQDDAQLLERFRVIRSNVQFTLVNRTNQILQVTSTIPGEGKSSTAANLAIAIALDARSVILVDADLHRPKINIMFGAPQQPGLSNVLVGQATMDEALQESNIPGLRLLPAGALPPNPAELLNSDSMARLMDQLRGAADIVIFDTPPCLATSDAQLLSARVDGVIYIMELGKIRKSAVQRSFELLYQARAHVLGVVFNKVSETEGSSYYDYGYYGYKNDEPRLPEAGKNGHHQSLNGTASIVATNNSDEGSEDHSEW